MNGYELIKDKNEIVCEDWLYDYDGGGITQIIPENKPVKPEMVGLMAHQAAYYWQYFSKPINDMKKEADATNPSYYTKYKYQPADFIEKHDLNFFQGNAIKYALRYQDKNGLEDLKKARWYAERFVKFHDPRNGPKRIAHASGGDLGFFLVQNEILREGEAWENSIEPVVVFIRCLALPYWLSFPDMLTSIDAMIRKLEVETK